MPFRGRLSCFPRLLVHIPSDSTFSHAFALRANPWQQFIESSVSPTYSRKIINIVFAVLITHMASIRTRPAVTSYVVH